MNLQILTGFLVCKITGNLLYFSAFTYFLNEYVLFSKSGKKNFFFQIKYFYIAYFKRETRQSGQGQSQCPPCTSAPRMFPNMAH